MFSKETYQNRRSALLNQLDGGIVLGEPIPKTIEAVEALREASRTKTSF